jgi:hypothetical protein
MNEHTKKVFTVFLISILAALLAGIYGILHDQITYNISPEYYTKFKFIQFNIYPDHFGTRTSVSLVGFFATWWFGFISGFILGIVNLLKKDWRIMLKASFKSIFITLITTLTIGIFGLIYGEFFLSEDSKSNFESWFIPEDVIDFKNFIVVGTIHNFGYIGGIIGLVLGVIYSYKKSNFHHK